VKIFTLIYKESGTSLAIDTGPGFGYSGWELKTTSQDIPFILEISWSGKLK